MADTKKLIIAGVALTAVGVGGYFLYSYVKNRNRAASVDLSQRRTNDTISTATGLLDALGRNGGVTGVLGSVFGNVGSLFPSANPPSVQPDGSVIAPDPADSPEYAG
jgi:hypothetical protein